MSKDNMEILMEIYDHGYDTLVVKYKRAHETVTIMAQRNPYKIFNHPGKVIIRNDVGDKYTRNLKKEESLWEAIQSVKDTNFGDTNEC